MLCLVDGDPIVYAAAFAAQKTISYFENSQTGEIKEFPSRSSLKNIQAWQEALNLTPDWELKKRVEIKPLKIALLAANAIIKLIYKECSQYCDRYRFYLTDSSRENNFRDRIATIFPYKGNRTQDKPVYYKAVREHLLRKYKAHLVSGEEADDRIGIVSMDERKAGKYAVIASIDKDLLTIPGKNFNYVTKEWKDVSNVEALRNFYYQILAGDIADNVPGVKKICMKFSEKFMHDILKGAYLKRFKGALEKCLDEKELFNYTYSVYRELQIPDYYLLEVGRLLKIRRERNEIWEFPKVK